LVPVSKSKTALNDSPLLTETAFEARRGAFEYHSENRVAFLESAQVPQTCLSPELSGTFSSTLALTASGFNSPAADGPAFIGQCLMVHSLYVLAEIVLLNAVSTQPCGLGALTSQVLEREILDWGRFKNRRKSYTELPDSERTTPGWMIHSTHHFRTKRGEHLPPSGSQRRQ